MRFWKWRDKQRTLGSGLGLALFFFLISFYQVSAQPLQNQIPSAEYNALVDLYNNTGGGGWANNTGWLDASAASWFGVGVAGGHVSHVYLNQNNLTGSLPSSLGNLTNMTAIDFRGNQITGAIPAAFGGLLQMQYLFLSSNQFSGSIPTNLANLTGLFDLDLGANQLTGQIPSGVGNLVKLALLDLHGNKLSGGIPSTLGNVPQLFELFLDQNRLSGAIPTSLATLAHLTSVNLSGNLLTGAVPDFTMFSGQSIDVSTNYLDISAGSQSLSNINAMISNGVTIYYLPQYIVPVVGPVMVSAGVAQVGLAGSPGQNYTIQSSSNLTTWTDWTNVTLPTNSGTYLDPSATNQAPHFYRAKVGQ